MSKKNLKTNRGPISLRGMMTYGRLDNGIMALDFACIEPAVVEAFLGNCKVQVSHYGDVYITQNPKRKRNTPLFRDDNCSLTLGRDQRYYFIFSMPETEVKHLPIELVRQSLAIAQKVDRLIIPQKKEDKQ